MLFPGTGGVRLSCYCGAFLSICYDRHDLLEYICSRRCNIENCGPVFSVGMFLKRFDCLRILDSYAIRSFEDIQYIMGYHTCYAFDAAHVQRILTRFPNIKGWELVVLNINHAFHILINATTLEPYFPFLSTLMDLASIFYPGSQFGSSEPVQNWLLIAAHCISSQMDWIKPHHIRLWHCFSVMHNFPMIHSHISKYYTHNIDNDQNDAFFRFTKNRLFDPNLLGIIATFLQQPSLFHPNDFKTKENLDNHFVFNAEQIPFRTLINAYRTEQDQINNRFASTSTSDCCFVLKHLAPSRLIRQLLRRFRENKIDFHFDWIKAIDLFILQDGI